MRLASSDCLPPRASTARSMGFMGAVKHSFTEQSSAACLQTLSYRVSIQAMLDPDRLSNEETAAIIRAAIAESPKTKAEIAEALGVTPQAITGWETTGRIGKATLAGLAALTGKPMQSFIARRSNVASDGGWHDLNATMQGVALGDGMAPDEYAETHKLKFRDSSLRRKGLRPQNLEVYYGNGDSMEPRIKDGDAILIDKSDKRIVDDKIYFIRHEGHYFVKRLQVHGDRMVFIVSDNRDDPQWRKPVLVKPSDDFEVLGRVRWLGSWED